VGQTIGGALSTNDQVQVGSNSRSYYFDAYSFTGVAGTGLAFDLRATTFDPALILYKRESNGALTPVAADDDLGGLGDGEIVNSNALLLTAITETREYVLFVTSSDDNPGGRGGYTLRIIGNSMQNIAYGATVNGQIAAGDLQTAAGDYLDAYWFAGAGGDRVQIKMASTSFDSFLILNKNNGATVAADDNGGGGQDAQIVFTLPETGLYVIVATPFAPNLTGGYTLELTRLTGLASVTESPLAELGRATRLNHEAKGANDDSRFQQFANRRIVER
jgi:hypothetical protein